MGDFWSSRIFIPEKDIGEQGNKSAYWDLAGAHQRLIGSWTESSSPKERLEKSVQLFPIKDFVN